LVSFVARNSWQRVDSLSLGNSLLLCKVFASNHTRFSCNKRNEEDNNDTLKVESHHVSQSNISDRTVKTATAPNVLAFIAGLGHKKELTVPGSIRPTRSLRAALM
jgi:hypothetical protein